MIFDKINPFYFFISFGIGLLLCYMFNPKPAVVVKFPSPYNAGQVVYQDKPDGCYKYKADKVTCPADKSLIKVQPLQEDFKSKREVVVL